jgi:hypothetical protein
MKHFNYHRMAIIAILLFVGFTAGAQTTSSKEKEKTSNTPKMKMYLIQRNIPGAGKLSEAELKAISQTSCSVLKEMGPKIEWIHSYVTGDNIFCVYKAENENQVKEHAKKGGFPANSIIEVATIISPATAGIE